MNVWKVRHEGSPMTSPDLTFDQVLQGLLDGKISPMDEVKGPTDAAWIKLEDHPAFSELAADMEPEPEKPHDEETNLDMNPLIDVALVLLIFFILTTTYSSLQKIIEAAEINRAKTDGVRAVPEGQVKAISVHVEVRRKDANSTVFVEKENVGDFVPTEGLSGSPLATAEEANRRTFIKMTNEMRRYARDPNRRTLLLDHDRKVPHGVIVQVQDAAKTAGLDKVQLLVP